ncbi:hypothetical protein QR680_001076 [Steinernema hermaphroditum]|uniref:UBX domain-containing protein n=1 Tax=Steinernema hermaphroditum TaxID=289476 RepID=A0AA39GWV6_9BILA|nr:hypothetical protein QR680_001076 [Steinernema hermaphroditum]
MGGLDKKQQEILNQFMELTNIADDDYATAVLASLDWDIEKAFEEFQSQNSDGDSDYLQPVNDSLNAAEDSLRNSPSSGYSSRPSGSKVTLSSNGVDSGSGSASSLMVVAGDTPLPSARSSDVTKQAESAAFEIASDDDPDEPEYYDLSNCRNSNDRPTLIPSNWSSEEEATSNFAKVFEDRYGAIHPFFHVGSLREAMREAFESPEIIERRPLAIYLHDDNSIASNIFAGKVLCASAVSDLLSGQYVTWAWDVTQSENKDKFLEWMRELHMYDVVQRVQMVRADNYPLLLVVTSSKSQIQLVDYATGHEYINNVTDKLIHGLSEYMDIKNTDRKEEIERQERERIRQEQQEEYEKALAADRARVQEEERDRQMQEEAEAEAKRKLSMKNRRCESLKKNLPAEPTATDKGVITFRVRFPGGQPMIRRFNDSDSLKSLVEFIESEGFFMEDYRIWNSNVPKQDISTFDLSKSFSELKFPAREQVIVDEK